MSILSYPTALATVQDALVRVIELALSDRTTTASLATLVAVASRGSSGAQAIADRQLCYVTSAATVFRYSQYSAATPDGATVLKPTDAGSGPGRWLVTSSEILAPDGTALSSVASGYLRRVMLWAGERTDEVWRERVLGLRPAVILQFTGETKTIHANQRGALAEKVYHFSVWAVSQNLRPDLEGERDSPVATEAAADPGVARIAGDLEYLLDGLRGADLGVGGLDFVAFGATEPGIEDFAGREFVWTAPLDVRVTVGKEDPVRAAFTTLYLQAKDVQLHGEAAVDDDNHVTDGLDVALGAGFARTLSGAAVVDGSTVNVSSTAHTFTANRTTWRDLRGDGTLAFVEGYTDDLEPVVTSGAMRVGLTRTDFSGVVEDRFLVATVEDVGPNNQIFPVSDGATDDRVYYGESADPGTYDQAFVEGFPSDVSTARQRTIQYDAAAGEYCWYWIPVTYGGSPADFVDVDSGFVVGFSIVGTAVRTEPGGAVVTFNGWRSDQSGLGSLTVQVT